MGCTYAMGFKSLRALAKIIVCNFIMFQVSTENEIQMLNLFKFEMNWNVSKFNYLISNLETVQNLKYFLFLDHNISNFIYF